MEPNRPGFEVAAPLGIPKGHLEQKKRALGDIRGVVSVKNYVILSSYSRGLGHL